MSQDILQTLALPIRQPSAADDPFVDVPRRATPVSPTLDPHDVLQALHEEFQRVVADPSQLAVRDLWEEDAPAHLRHAPAFDELCRQASVHPQVLDVLSPRESLDRFLSRFLASLDSPDATQAPALLAEIRAAEVLQLFAPAAADGGPSSLPVTTRRDHHVLSPDSALDPRTFGASRPAGVP